MVAPLAHDVSPFVQWAPTASAVAAIIAAVVAWRSAAQARRSRRPELQAQPTWNLPTRHARIHIENSGGGLAKGAGYYAVVRGEQGAKLVVGYVPVTGFLRPGQGVTVRTNEVVAADGTAPGIAFCLDASETQHVWSFESRRHKRFPSRPWRRSPPQPPDLFDKFYKDVEHRGLPEAEFEVALNE